MLLCPINGQHVVSKYFSKLKLARLAWLELANINFVDCKVLRLESGCNSSLGRGGESHLCKWSNFGEMHYLYII
jgi:hypothetical protein